MTIDRLSSLLSPTSCSRHSRVLSLLYYLVTKTLNSIVIKLKLFRIVNLGVYGSKQYKKYLSTLFDKISLRIAL